MHLERNLGRYALKRTRKKDKHVTVRPGGMDLEERPHSEVFVLIRVFFRMINLDGMLSPPDIQDRAPFQTKPLSSQPT